MTMQDIRAQGMAGRLGAQMTAVVVDGHKGKEYRLPTEEELQAAQEAADHVDEVFKDVPFGLPTEPLPTKEALGFRVPLYGFDQWHELFTPRQLVALGTFVKHTRALKSELAGMGYPELWPVAITSYLASVVDRVANRGSTQCMWGISTEKIEQTFARFALPIHWDFPECSPFSGASGNYRDSVEWVAKVLEHVANAKCPEPPLALRQSATQPMVGEVDLVLTDPPYYDAIPYSDLMDFFYVWLRRTLYGLSPEFDETFVEPLGPKWDRSTEDGELIDDASRFAGDGGRSKKTYEDGMFRAFRMCREALTSDGRMVIVFANKNPAAWEVLVSAMIRAGFIVDGSWPIQTEMSGGVRNYGRAALASSIWLVCRKRTDTARPGWDTQVLEEMRQNIYEKLRLFWDAGIRGPDFVWAATGPALEAYSKHPIVKKADEPNSLMTVSEFLQHVRRIVVDYVVGRILSQNGDSEATFALDDVSLYYLLHRHQFGLREAPVGASILYAQSCNLRDRDLADRFDVLAYGKSRAAAAVEEDDEGGGDETEAEEPASSGSTVKLKRWEQRGRKNLGVSADRRPAPLIDQSHRIMHLWRAGDVQRVDAYIEDQGLRRNPVFPRLIQALIELAGKDGQPDERALLESIMNHVTAQGAHPQMRLRLEED